MLESIFFRTPFGASKFLRSVGRRRGMALVVVLVLSLILIALSGGVTRMAVHQTHDLARYEVYKDEFAAAEAALNKAYSAAQFMVRNRTPNRPAQLTALTAPVMDGFTFPTYRIQQTFNSSETDPATGFIRLRESYSATVTAKRTKGLAQGMVHPGVTLTETIDITSDPPCRNAIWYNDELEIAPSPLMEVRGRVHSNGDLYVQGTSGIGFFHKVTAVGNLFHGRDPNAKMATEVGYVRFTDDLTKSAVGSLVNMAGGTGDTNADGWLDSKDTNWNTTRQGRWKDNVRDKADGVAKQDPPVPAGYDPHALIDRADPANDPAGLAAEKFENKAALRIVRKTDGSVVGLDQQGNNVPLTYLWPTNPAPGQTQVVKSIIRVFNPATGAEKLTCANMAEWNAAAKSTKFFDSRESGATSAATAQADAIDVNIANLKESGKNPYNGILYVSNENQGTQKGVVRLFNGSSLPTTAVADGFTVASDDPIYIKGDYNTVSPKIALVAGDALMILSNAWNDANSAYDKYGSRTATATTVNTVVMAGIVPSGTHNTGTGNQDYSGGVENYFRFLENWGGVGFTYSGSIIELWLSKKFLGRWSGQSYTYYSPPNRYWSWDPRLATGAPPGMVMISQIARSDWKLGGS